MELSCDQITVLYEFKDAQWNRKTLDFKCLFPMASQSYNINIIKFTIIIVLFVIYLKNKNPQVHISSSKPQCTQNLFLTSKKSRMWCLFGHFWVIGFLSVSSAIPSFTYSVYTHVWCYWQRAFIHRHLQRPWWPLSQKKENDQYPS